MLYYDVIKGVIFISNSSVEAFDKFIITVVIVHDRSVVVDTHTQFFVLSRVYFHLEKNSYNSLMKLSLVLQVSVVLCCWRAAQAGSSWGQVVPSLACQ